MLPLLELLAGLALLSFSSSQALERSLRIAKALSLPTFFAGLAIASVGTNLPEIFNSLLAHAMGHGDLNVGDSLGSPLAQSTLVVAIALLSATRLVFSSRELKALALALVIAFSAAILAIEDGFLSRVDGFLLVLVWVSLLALLKPSLPEGEVDRVGKATLWDVFLLLLSFAGAGLGAYLTVKGAVALSTSLGMEELVFAFFALGIATSLPELALEIKAMRRGLASFALGDAFGSSMVDATLSLGVGPLLRPLAVSPALPLAFYTLFASLAVLGAVLLLRRRAWVVAALLYVLGVILFLVP